MKNPAGIALLLLALVAPVIVFLLLASQQRLQGVIAAAVAVATGWALNIAWASSTGDDARRNRSIALRFGWACPAVLVLLAWLVRHFAGG